MIGMMNMGEDAEFYAAARQSSLYQNRNQRRSTTIGYTLDGRKTLDGKPTGSDTPDEMWEQLLLRAITAKVKDTMTGEKMLERTSSSTSLHNIDLDDIELGQQNDDDDVFKQSIAKLSPESRRKLRNRCTSDSKLDAFMEETKNLHLKEQKNAAIQKKASHLSDKQLMITHF